MAVCLSVVTPSLGAMDAVLAADGATDRRDDPGAVLAWARARRQAAEQAEADLVVAAVEWAIMHPAVDTADRATWPGTEGELTVAGAGAPTISEFAVLEFAAALGLSTDAGRALIGQAVELRYRLPRVWRLLTSGRVQAWRARRVAEHTIALTFDAAAFVDAQVAAVAGRIGPIQLDRLVETAIARHDPERAEELARRTADTRHVTIHDQSPTLAGTVDVTAILDLGDARDLDAAVSHTASQLAALGSTDPLDVRRAQALGDLARRQLALDLTGDGDAASDAARRRLSRRTVVYVHLTDAALTSGGIGRCETTRSPISVDRIRHWCAAPDARVTVTPVIDLTQPVRSDHYEIPTAAREQVVLRDSTCSFPWCRRPARGCDLDHVDEFDATTGSVDTSSDNLAPLCRRHHRAKTHSAWRYRMLDPGVYHWTSPHGLTYLVTGGGTHSLDVASPDRGHPDTG